VYEEASLKGCNIIAQGATLGKMVRISISPVRAEEEGESEGSKYHGSSPHTPPHSLP